MPTVFVFVDGLGIGARDEATNPLVAARSEIFDNFADGRRERPLPFGGRLCPLDATLETEGRPQSATGQTALLTGINGAREIGRHLMGFPNKRLREILAGHSLLKRLRERGRRVLFANAFRPIWFLLPPAVRDRRTSATTAATLAAGIPLRSVADIPIGEAVYHDFTNRGLLEEGHDVPERSPREAGRALGRLAGRHHFVLYEHFLTDKAGHAQDRVEAIGLIENLDAFLRGLLETLDLGQDTVLLASDHGNVEDLSHGGHTMNPAMGLVWGRGAEEAPSKLASVMDVTGFILDLDEGSGGRRV